eukprot:892226_1
MTIMTIMTVKKKIYFMYQINSFIWIILFGVIILCLCIVLIYVYRKILKGNVAQKPEEELQGAEMSTLHVKPPTVNTHIALASNSPNVTAATHKTYDTMDVAKDIEIELQKNKENEIQPVESD